MDMDRLTQLLEEAATDERAVRELLERSGAAMANIVRHMAVTGQGTDACLDRRCLPMPVHFYSPVPDIPDLRRRGVFDHRTDMAGVDFRPHAQEALLLELGMAFGGECDWPRDATGDPLQFYTHNGCFSYGCAAALHCMVRRHKPRRIVEAGSGNSSLVIGAALARNAAEGHPCHYTIVDPYPRDAFRNLELPFLSCVEAKPVEELPVELFMELREGDILFVDSSHAVKTGGDVNFLILDVLPRLAPGVVVHFHDIHLPYEYCEAYFTNPTFRVFWTEGYLLQAFLAYNEAYEVLLGMAWLMSERAATFEKAFTCFDPAQNWANSGSFWIRRKV